jgi:hypothetical protein
LAKHRVKQNTLNTKFYGGLAATHAATFIRQELGFFSYRIDRNSHWLGLFSSFISYS